MDNITRKFSQFLFGDDARWARLPLHRGRAAVFGAARQCARRRYRVRARAAGEPGQGTGAGD